MRKYRIHECRSGQVCIDADTPQDALKILYKDFDISIQLSDSKDATHIVELINTSRKSVNYYIVTFNCLSRKPKPDNWVEPMPKRQLQGIIKDFKKKGGLILIDDDTDNFLRKQGAEGSTLNESTILLVKNPSRSAVYEELIHAEQYRKGKNDGSRKSRLICEIEAQKMLICKKDELGITDKENEQTKLALRAYEEEYRQLKRRG